MGTPPGVMALSVTEIGVPILSYLFLGSGGKEVAKELSYQSQTLKIIASWAGTRIQKKNEILHMMGGARMELVGGA